MSVVVFLGPSLPVDDGRALVDATFLPPVRAGDIVRALALEPDAIGIVDGYFDRVPSVWHKEISRTSRSLTPCSFAACAERKSIAGSRRRQPVTIA